MLTALCIIIALFIAFQLGAYFTRRADETAEQVYWANFKEPLFYECPDASARSKVWMASQAEYAKEMLVKHGNKYIGPEDVFCWIHGAEGFNTESDFRAWRDVNREREKAIIESFRALKAQAAARASQTEFHARTMAGEFQEYKTTEK